MEYMLETIVSGNVAKVAKRNPDMGLFKRCMQIAARDDEETEGRIADGFYARKTVGDEISAVQLHHIVLRTGVLYIQSGLPVSETQLRQAHDSYLEGVRWLNSLVKVGSLQRMPGYALRYMELSDPYWERFFNRRVR